MKLERAEVELLIRLLSYLDEMVYRGVLEDVTPMDFAMLYLKIAGREPSWCAS